MQGGNKMAELDINTTLDDQWEWDCEKYSDLGKKIINSCTLFEDALSFLVHVEGEAIDLITRSLPGDIKGALPDLIDFNEATSDIMCYLSEIKEIIIEELDLGNEIANKDNA